MATLQDLINSVNTLQDSVTVLTEEVNFKKADLVQAVLESEQSETQAGQSVTLAQQAVTDAEALVVLAQQAVTDTQALVVIAQQAVADTEDQVVIATNQASASATSANEANQLISSTQNLFVNFFDSAIISLNSRIVSENATIVIKLRFVQAELDTL